jgi:predicted nuclease with RNAse H fold
MVMEVGKKQDADAFCKHHIQRLKPDFVMIDAPLSLPAAYKTNVGRDDNRVTDFFFRQADRQLSAMSPMFLGGLTARAMQLAAYFAPSGILFFETWPTRLRQYFGSDQRPEQESMHKHLLMTTGIGLLPDCQLSRHGIDSVLAWYSGWLKINKKSLVFGDAAEGLIWC